MGYVGNVEFQNNNEKKKNSYSCENVSDNKNGSGLRLSVWNLECTGKYVYSNFFEKLYILNLEVEINKMSFKK